MLVISSVNGHGHIDGERLIRRLRGTKETSGLPAVIGGKLGIHGTANVSFTQQLIDAGFNTVFEASAGIEAFENYVRQLSFSASVGHPFTVSDDEI
jgi:methylmalonyl-CoA mutase cobalamin-binding subunit